MLLSLQESWTDMKQSTKVWKYNLVNANTLMKHMDMDFIMDWWYYSVIKAFKVDQVSKLHFKVSLKSLLIDQEFHMESIIRLCNLGQNKFIT